MGFCSTVRHICSNSIYGSAALLSGAVAFGTGVVGVGAFALSLPLWASLVAKTRFFDLAGQLQKADAGDRLPAICAVGGICLLTSFCSYKIMKASLSALSHTGNSETTRSLHNRVHIEHTS